jgi:hypothetical protein
MIQKFLVSHKHHAVIFLLWAGLFLKGTKTPEAFFVWGIFALVVIGLHLRAIAATFSIKNHTWELAFAISLAVSQIFSKDPSITLYYSAQAFLFLLLWTTLKAVPETLPSLRTLIIHLTAMAGVSLLVTFIQFSKGPWQYGYGLFPINPIFNAAWIGCIAATLVAYLLHGASRDTSPLERRLLWIAAGVYLVVCVVLPARSSVLALAIALLYTGYRHITVRRSMSVLGLLLLIAIIIPNRMIYKRLRLNEGNYRQSLWSVAWHAATDFPLVGRGFGNFEMAYQRHAFPVETDPARFTHTTAFAHNEFLQLASDSGFPAFLILCFSVFTLIFIPIYSKSGVQPVAKTAFIMMTVLASYNIVWHLPIFIFFTLLWTRMFFDPERTPRQFQPEPNKFSVPCLLVVIGAIALSLGWYALRGVWDRQGRWDLIVRYQPRDASAWKQLADQQKDLGKSLYGYEQASLLVPAQPYFHESLARALSETRQPNAMDRSLMEYALALQEAPGRATNALAIGRLLLLRGDPQRAQDWFEKARRIEPHYWECDLWIARCLVRLQKRREAILTLVHLKKRRDIYLKWREQVLLDLPAHYEVSDYEKTILAYDENVRTRELSALLNP